MSTNKPKPTATSMNQNRPRQTRRQRTTAAVRNSAAVVRNNAAAVRNNAAAVRNNTAVVRNNAADVRNNAGVQLRLDPSPIRITQTPNQSNQTMSISQLANSVPMPITARLVQCTTTATGGVGAVVGGMSIPVTLAHLPASIREALERKGFSINLSPSSNTTPTAIPPVIASTTTTSTATVGTPIRIVNAPVPSQVRINKPSTAALPAAAAATTTPQAQPAKQNPPPKSKSPTSTSTSTTTTTTPTTVATRKPPGTPKRLGHYCVGPGIGSMPVKSMNGYICRRNGTDQYCVIKTVTLKDEGDETLDDRQGKELVQTERKLLVELRGIPGVVQQYGFFMDTAIEDEMNNDGEKIGSREVKRMCLVLECFVGHDFGQPRRHSNLTNLQNHVIKNKKIPEQDALKIFYDAVQIVERIHERQIIHRDIKLANFILDKVTRELSLCNFVLGKRLETEDDLLSDKRGSPAYISPEILSGTPYKGKPADMWALGVTFYTMLYGLFPFYHSDPPQLFLKIREGKLEFPTETRVSSKTLDIIKRILVVNPDDRLTVPETVAILKAMLLTPPRTSVEDSTEAQVVPDCHPGAAMPIRRARKRRYSESEEFEKTESEAVVTVNQTDNNNQSSQSSRARAPPRMPVISFQELSRNNALKNTVNSNGESLLNFTRRLVLEEAAKIRAQSQCDSSKRVKKSEQCKGNDLVTVGDRTFVMVEFPPRFNLKQALESSPFSAGPRLTLTDSAPVIKRS